MMQYVPIVPGQYKGEAISGSTVQQMMTRVLQIVNSLGQLVDQYNNNFRSSLKVIYL